MAAFGKADVGLIKATAGAEAGQYMDTSLALGSAIGGFLKTLQEQQAATRKKNAGLQAEIDKNFDVLTGNLDPNLDAYLVSSYATSVRDVSNISGTGMQSKRLKKEIFDVQNGKNESASTVQGNLNYVRSGDFTIPSGAVGTDKETFYLHIKAKKEVNYFTTYDDAGDAQIMMAVPKEIIPQFTVEGTSDYTTFKKLEKREKDETLTADQKIEIQAFRDQELEYLKWTKGIHTNNDGSYNPQKYIIQNGANMSVGENMNNKRDITKVYNQHVTNVTSDPALKTNIPPADFAAYVTTTLGDGDFKEGSPNLGESMQDVAFNTNLGFGSDWNKDGEADSFASVFIGGVNPDKIELRKLMYTNIDGSAINWEFDKLGFTDDDIAKYDKDGNGKIEWSDDPDSEWMLLPQETKEGMLDIWLRGTNSDGTSDPDKRVEWIKNRYASFMGEVLHDARKAKQKNHFSAKNMYFDSQGADGDQTVNPIHKNESEMGIQKGITYNKTKFNVALPVLSLGNGIDMTKTSSALHYQGKKLTDAPVLVNSVKNLKTQFPNCTFSVKGGKLRVENGEGDSDFFDFEVGKFTTNTKTDVKNEYKRLSIFLAGEEHSDNDNTAINNLGTSVDDDSWKKFQNQQYEFYPENRVAQDFGQGKNGILISGQYENFKAKTATGKVLDISGQRVKIVGYDKGSGKYKVQVMGTFAEEFPEQLVDLVIK